MKTILKLCVFCWYVVVAFCIFFLIPFELMGPLTAALFAVALGASLLVWQGRCVRRFYKEEGADFGLFMLAHKGFWRSLACAVGATLFLFGGAWIFAPRSTGRALEAGAMPFAIFLVLLFWFSLVFVFLGFAVVCFAEGVAYARMRHFKTGAGSVALALVWLALATLFCSLFLEVIDDNFVGLPEPTQRLVLALFAVAVAAAGLLSGSLQAPDRLLPEEELKARR